MKNKKINIGILIIALALVLYFTLKDNFSGILKELSEVNILIFILAIIIFILSLAFKSISLHIFIKEHKKNYSYKDTFSLTLIGQFLNGITPFQSGGQPFQIYLLKKQGIRISDSTRAMIKDFISFQIALIIMGIVAIIANFSFHLVVQKSYLNWLIFVGFLINLIVLIFLLMVSSAKKSVVKIIDWMLNYISKFKWGEKINKENLMEGLNHFYQSGNELKKDKKNLVISVFTNIINLFLLYVVPFIIFRALGCDRITILSSTIVTAFVMLIGNFIPIPGATGGVEYSFIQFFKGFSVDMVLLSGAMLLWRFVTYFIGMLIGFIVLIIRKGEKR